MLIRLSPMFVLPAVLLAGVAGYVAADRPHSSVTPTANAAVATHANANTQVNANAAAPSGQLPPGHPSIPGAGASPHSPHGGGASTPEPASLDWTVPSGWQTEPNPSPMRLATYKVGGAEMSVSRAGGGADANITRWSTQFDGSPKPERTEKQVHGMKVTVVRIAGTFLGTGMGTTTTPEKHERWAMLAAIVDPTGSEYFFKLTGPADQVDGARGSFDALVESFAPHAAP